MKAHLSYNGCTGIPRRTWSLWQRFLPFKENQDQPISWVFPKKKKRKKNQFLNYYYLNGINIKLYCLVYILKSQGVELIDKQK